MSETLIPGYYNTKINNHDWVIYMGGERYFPAYPVKQPDVTSRTTGNNGIPTNWTVEDAQ